MTHQPDAAVTTRTQPVFPPDYLERVYAGVLGKVVGVYLGRPFEQWTYEQIRDRLGNVRSYVSEELGKPLVVTDDDITGTFTFIRAAADSGHGYATTGDDVAEAWLNYLIEERSVLWWGGLGNSTEHTAYLRLKAGYRPPASGSAELNGRAVAEQIGAQIFVDGWAMIAPGAPDLAADLAERAARVSHDGEAVYGARALAAMESVAFLTQDVDALIDAGLSVVPDDCLIRSLVTDLRSWHVQHASWRDARALLEQHYGYEIYGGECHMIPNHGLIVLALLYGEGDFTRSLEIVNTAGWDTDCNSGNLGALLGILGGLDALDAGPDWRGPVADKIYLPTAVGGRGISDALTEAVQIARTGLTAAGLPFSPPKDGARFHFDAPGAVQGFTVDPSQPAAVLRNELMPDGARALRLSAPGPRASASTPTFLPREAFDMQGYALDVSPTLYSGQTVVASVQGAREGVEQRVQLVARVYDAGDRYTEMYGPVHVVSSDRSQISWELPDTEGQPIQSIGVQVVADTSVDLFIDSLTWSGAPDVRLGRPDTGGTAWRRAWVVAMDYEHKDPQEGFRLVHNEGRGCMVTGTPDWTDYSVEARVFPHAATAAGIVARFQGLRRYYALRWSDAGALEIVRHRAGEDEVLARTDLAWSRATRHHLTGTSHRLAFDLDGARLRALVDDDVVLEVEDPDGFDSGAAGLFVENGRASVPSVAITPVRSTRPESA